MSRKAPARWQSAPYCSLSRLWAGSHSCRLALCDKNRLLTSDKVEGVVPEKRATPSCCTMLASAHLAREPQSRGENRHLDPCTPGLQRPGENLPHFQSGLIPARAAYRKAWVTRRKRRTPPLSRKRTVSPRTVSTVDRDSSCRIHLIQGDPSLRVTGVPNFQRHQVYATVRLRPWLRVIGDCNRQR